MAFTVNPSGLGSERQQSVSIKAPRVTHLPVQDRETLPTGGGQNTLTVFIGDLLFSTDRSDGHSRESPQTLPRLILAAFLRKRFSAVVALRCVNIWRSLPPQRVNHNATSNIPAHD